MASCCASPLAKDSICSECTCLMSAHPGDAESHASTACRLGRQSCVRLHIAISCLVVDGRWGSAARASRLTPELPACRTLCELDYASLQVAKVERSLVLLASSASSPSKLSSPWSTRQPPILILLGLQATSGNKMQRPFGGAGCIGSCGHRACRFVHNNHTSHLQWTMV